MKHLITAAFCLTLLAPATVPAQAQDESISEGMDLLSQGTKLLLQGLMGEIEPALRELEGALRDLNAYHPPEVLPNGDIIIRRKVPRQKTPPQTEEGDIDL